MEKDEEGNVSIQIDNVGGDDTAAGTVSGTTDDGPGPRGAPSRLTVIGLAKNEEIQDSDSVFTTSIFDSERGPLVAPPDIVKGRRRSKSEWRKISSLDLYPRPTFARFCEACFHGNCRNHRCVSKMPDAER